MLKNAIKDVKQIIWVPEDDIEIFNQFRQLTFAWFNIYKSRIGALNVISLNIGSCCVSAADIHKLIAVASKYKYDIILLVNANYILGAYPSYILKNNYYPSHGDASYDLPVFHPYNGNTDPRIAERIDVAIEVFGFAKMKRRVVRRWRRNYIRRVTDIIMLLENN